MLQSASLKTWQTKFGHYQGAQCYNLLKGKCKGNIVLFYLHCSSDVRKQIDREILPKNTKLTRLVTL